MKTLSELLTENKKTYSFKVRLAACECSKEMLSGIKSVLSVYEVTAISEPVRSLITEHNTLFPELSNFDITTFNILTDYPATPEQISLKIREHLRMPASHIVVMTERQDELTAPPAPSDKKSLLGNEYPATEQAKFLFDLEKLLKDHKSTPFEFAEKAPAESGPKTLNDVPQTTKSVIGSK